MRGNSRAQYSGGFAVLAIVVLAIAMLGKGNLLPEEKDRLRFSTPFVLLSATVVAMLLLLIAALILGLSLEVGAVVILVLTAVAMLLAAGMRSNLLQRMWRDARRQLEAVAQTHAAPSSPNGCEESTDETIRSARTPEDQFWYLPVAFVCAVVGVFLAVLAVMSIWDVSFVDVIPWLLTLGAVIFAILTLMAVSYAPPGPNWVQRIAGVDGRVLLSMLGLFIVLFATAEYFDFEVGEAPPSDWWLALAAIGLLIGLAGTNPPRTAKRRLRPTADDAAAHANRALESAALATAYERKAKVIGDATGANETVTEATQRAQQAASDAAMSATQASQQAQFAKELEKGVGTKVGRAADTAKAAAASSEVAQLAHRQAKAAQRAAERNGES
jgi:hypothetical protein